VVEIMIGKASGVLRKRTREIEVINPKNRNYIIGKKIIAIFVMVAFLFQFEMILHSQSEDEIVNQFHRAKDRYEAKQYDNARQRLLRLVGIIEEKGVDRKDIVGMCYLLLGAIYEAETNGEEAEANYRKAIDIYGIALVDGVDLDALPIYRKIVKGEGQTSPDEEMKGGTIEKAGNKKKGKKIFPWLLVAGGVVVVAIIAFILLKKKKKYTLAVTLGEGVNGSPGNGNHSYTKGETVAYGYSVQPGYGNLTVLRDGNAAAASDTITMNSNHTLRVTTDPLGFVADKTQLEVPEEGSATFNLHLSGRPQGDLHVQVSPIDGGDPSLSVSSGSVLTFTTDNWETDQTVTISAAKDDDAENGSATFQVVALSGEVSPIEIVATEADNGTRGFETNVDTIIVEEEGNATFKVRLTSAPTGSITVTINRLDGGDTDISLKSSSTLTFDSFNWNTFQDVVLEAADDNDTDNGQAIFRISADDYTDKDITAIESDTDILHFITDTNLVRVKEDETEVFHVKLSAVPSSIVNVNVAWLSGDEDITVSSSPNLSFNSANWNDYQEITLAAARDDDAVDGEAIIRISATNNNNISDKDVTVEEIDDDPFSFQTDPDIVTVPEEGTQTFQVKLTAKPSTTVNARVERLSGDSDITVDSNPNLTFTPSTWDQYQIVTLAAVKDEDEENGQAVIRISAPGVTEKDITAIEDDNGAGGSPIISITNPNNGDTVYDDVTIEVAANDDVGVTKVEFYVDNVLIGTDDDGFYQQVWSTLNVALGSHEIKAIAYDSADNTSETSITVTVGDNPPTVDAIRLNPNETPLTGTNEISIDASDYKGVQTIRFYVDDVLQSPEWNGGPQTSVTFTLNLDTSAFSNGSHTFKAIAIDSSGQSSAPLEQSVTIQN
jgi:Bacterial Ig domain